MRKLLVVALACLGGSAHAQWFTTFGNTPIPDGTPAGVDVLINVAGVGNNLLDVNFGTVIEHTWQGDLVMTLTSPNAITATLLFRAGTGGAAGFGFDDNDFGDPGDVNNQATWFVLDDSAVDEYDIPDLAAGIPQVDGTWIPYTGSLAAFNGIDPNGVWTANFSDNQFDDTGSVLMAGVQIDAVPEPASMIALGIGVTALLARRRRKRA